MRFSIILLAIAGLAIASPVPVQDNEEPGILDPAIKALKTGAKNAVNAGVLAGVSSVANKINDKVQKEWSADAIKAKQEKVDKAAAEVKGKGADAMGALRNLAKGVAGVQKPSEKKKN